MTADRTKASTTAATSDTAGVFLRRRLLPCCCSCCCSCRCCCCSCCCSCCCCRCSSRCSRLLLLPLLAFGVAAANSTAAAALALFAARSTRGGLVDAAAGAFYVRHGVTPQIRTRAAVALRRPRPWRVRAAAELSARRRMLGELTQESGMKKSARAQATWPSQPPLSGALQNSLSDEIEHLALTLALSLVDVSHERRDGCAPRAEAAESQWRACWHCAAEMRSKRLPRSARARARLHGPRRVPQPCGCMSQQV